MEDKLCGPECEKHGECNNGTCICDPGYGGLDCLVALCPKNCSGRGICEHDGRCRCNVGYGGEDCSKAVCLSDCSGHGTCNIDAKTGAGKCTCQLGLAGEHCNIPICHTKKCVNGYCVDGMCYCLKGFTGSSY